MGDCDWCDMIKRSMLTCFLKGMGMIEKVNLNTVKGFEDVKDYYFVVRDVDRCWVEGKNGKLIVTGKQIGRAHV